MYVDVLSKYSWYVIDVLQIKTRQKFYLFLRVFSFYLCLFSKTVSNESTYNHSMNTTNSFADFFINYWLSESNCWTIQSIVIDEQKCWHGNNYYCLYCNASFVKVTTPSSINSWQWRHGPAIVDRSADSYLFISHAVRKVWCHNNYKQPRSKKQLHKHTWVPT